MSEISKTPISKLKVAFDNAFGKDEWFDLEAETIIMALEIDHSDLLHDKIYVLKALGNNPLLFYNDFSFALYSADVINNKSADFNTIPSITSLEMAYAITEAGRVALSMGMSPDFNNEFVLAVTYMLRHEGYSDPVPPFQFIPETSLEPGQTKEDSLDKAKAISMYIQSMDSMN